MMVKLMFYLQNAFNNIIKAESIITEREAEATGLVRIGIYSHLSSIIMPKVIKEFKKIHPGAKFSIFQSTNRDMIEILKRRDIDFVILQYPIFLEKNNFEEEILCNLETCFYSNKEMYEKYKEDKDMIYPLILPFNGYADIDSLEEKLKRHNIKFTNDIRSYSSATIKEMVKENLGIGWGLKKLIQKELDNNELFEIPLDFNYPQATFSIAYDKNFLNNTAMEFLNFLKDNINKLI